MSRAVYAIAETGHAWRQYPDGRVQVFLGGEWHDATPEGARAAVVAFNAQPVPLPRKIKASHPRPAPAWRTEVA